ncbi:MAG: D-hydroxyproline dehydrogenase [Bradyrhizobium sp.]|nr:D-hydroxyproline dehydrogenase [Bradyrhizobium sp.]
MATKATQAASNAVVVGAGIVGVCCSYALQRAGFNVTLIEKDEPGRAASYGNSGSIGLSSSPPLGTPGMLKDVPRMLLDPMHALVIRWRHLPRAVPWFLKLARTLKPEKVEAIAKARAMLLSHAGQSYDDLLAEIGRPEIIYQAGLLFAYETDKAFAGAQYGADLRRRSGIEVRAVDAGAMRDMEPALSDKVRHGLFLPDVRTTTHPLRLPEAILAAFVARGGRLVKEAVVGFERNGSNVTAVRTDRGRHPCDLAVISAGAWSRDLVKLLGDRTSLESERGYHIMIDGARTLPRIPVVSGDHNVSITAMEGGLRMTTMAEFAAIDAPPDHERAMRIFKGAAGLIRDLELKVASRWVGSRPSTPDSLPVIGRSPRAHNVFYAFGHGHLGVTFGAITGKLIAQMAREERPNIDVSLFRPDRDFTADHLMQGSQS